MDTSARTRPVPVVFTTDVNGTTTGDNTFAELVRPHGRAAAMADLMAAYTAGERPFAAVLPEMRRLADQVDRNRLEAYARAMPLFPGVAETFSRLVDAPGLRVFAALSTTGFAGLMALVNKYRHGGRLFVAASDVGVEHLTEDERRPLMRFITAEKDKIDVIELLVALSGARPGHVFHAGDTMGDFPALAHVARTGGTAIAFCPNQALRQALAGLEPAVRANVRIVEPDADIGPNYARVGEIVLGMMAR